MLKKLKRVENKKMMMEEQTKKREKDGKRAGKHQENGIQVNKKEKRRITKGNGRGIKKEKKEKKRVKNVQLIFKTKLSENISIRFYKVNI